MVGSFVDLGGYDAAKAGVVLLTAVILIGAVGLIRWPSK
jgi:hypothetical protein